MKFILCFAIATLALFSFNPCCFSQNLILEDTNSTHYVKFQEGTIFRAVLQHKISTSLNKVEDTVDFIIPADIVLGEIVVIPKNSKFTGKIIKLEDPKQGRNGYFEIIIDKLIFPEGQEIDLLAHIHTKTGDGIIGGEFTERTKFKKVKHDIQGIGSILQLLPDGPRQMGKDTEILPGEEKVIVLDKELELAIVED